MFSSLKAASEFEALEQRDLGVWEAIGWCPEVGVVKIKKTASFLVRVKLHITEGLYSSLPVFCQCGEDCKGQMFSYCLLSFCCCLFICFC